VTNGEPVRPQAEPRAQLLERAVEKLEAPVLVHHQPDADAHVRDAVALGHGDSRDFGDLVDDEVRAPARHHVEQARQHRRAAQAPEHIGDGDLRRRVVVGGAGRLPVGRLDLPARLVERVRLEARAHDHRRG
jgi:hypothetical protein